MAQTSTSSATDQHVDPADRTGAIDEVRAVAGRLTRAMETVIEGKPAVIRTTITALLAGGHLLIEDVPGVGKTMLAKALAKSVACSVRRIQFTPDLLPSDITGVSVFNPETRHFEFRPGAVFAHVVVCDEINRASPKVQSALLESMEEGQVTVDGQTYLLPQPFIVMATQNPLEMEGTYPLPEAQRDRFLARIAMGYPDPSAEIAMLDTHSGRSPLDELEPVTDATTIARLVHVVQGVYASPALRHYVVDLVSASRVDRSLRLGASPRAAIHLVRAARAHAALEGRDYALPEDIRRVAHAVLRHRLVLSPDALLARRTPDEIITDLLRTTPIPAAPR